MTTATVDDAEQRTRAALVWTMKEAPIRFPEGMEDQDAWAWDDPDSSLFCRTNLAVGRFHVEAEFRGRKRTRIAVLRLTAGTARLQYDAELPD